MAAISASTANPISRTAPAIPRNSISRPAIPASKSGTPNTPASASAFAGTNGFPESARAMALMGAELLFFPTAIGSEPQDPTLDSSRPLATHHARPRRRQPHPAHRLQPHRHRTRRSTAPPSPSTAPPSSPTNTGAKIAEADRTDETVLTATFDLDAHRPYPRLLGRLPRPPPRSVRPPAHAGWQHPAPRGEVMRRTWGLRPHTPTRGSAPGPRQGPKALGSHSGFGKRGSPTARACNEQAPSASLPTRIVGDLGPQALSGVQGRSPLVGEWGRSPQGLPHDHTARGMGLPCRRSGRRMRGAG